MSGPTVAVMTVTMPGREQMVLARARELVRQTYPISEWILTGPSVVMNMLFRDHSNFAGRWPNCAVSFNVSDSNIPTRRNECARASSADIIVQVDDDDWQHPTRIERQVRDLTCVGPANQPQVVGTNWVYAYFRRTKQIHRIAFWNALAFVPGATLAYWREAWQRHTFNEDATHGEDGPFVGYFHHRGEFLNQREPTLILYNRHGGNMSTDELYLPTSRTGQRRTPQEILADRRREPGKPLPLQYDDSALDTMRAHESEVNRLFWREEMGIEEFARFTGEE